MGPEEQEQWKDQVLAELLKGITVDPQLSESLIFKGARILNRHLDSKRQSLDIDSNLTVEFLDHHPDRIERAQWFESNLERALHHYFEEQEPVRFEVGSVKVKNSPQRTPHEFGWNGLIAEIRLQDFQNKGVRGLPILKIDIASPEKLGENALCEIELDGVGIRAYSLIRIGGEKLRAFLSSLPTYRKKINTSNRAARAKDLYDLARILEANPLEVDAFWNEVSKEFVLACESRYVDCEGLHTFLEDIERTEQTYQTDATLSEIGWDEAFDALTRIVKKLEEKGLFPLRFPLPEPTDDAV